MAAQKLYAFWRYDLWPYFVHGEIEKINNNGGICISRGFNIRPEAIIKVLPGAAGRNIGEQLKLLKTAAEEAVDQIKKRSLEADGNDSGLPTQTRSVGC